MRYFDLIKKFNIIKILFPNIYFPNYSVEIVTPEIVNKMVGKKGGFVDFRCILLVYFEMAVTPEIVHKIFTKILVDCSC